VARASVALADVILLGCSITTGGAIGVVLSVAARLSSCDRDTAVDMEDGDDSDTDDGEEKGKGRGRKGEQMDGGDDSALETLLEEAHALYV
jgi:hypothetical protein